MRICLNSSIENIEYHTKFSASSLVWIDKGSDYSPSTATLSAPSSTSNAATSSTPTASDLTFVTTGEPTYQNTIVDRIEEQTFTVEAGVPFELTPEVSCTTVDGTSISYSPVFFEDETYPVWATTNSMTGVITGTLPTTGDVEKGVFLIEMVSDLYDPGKFKKITITTASQAVVSPTSSTSSPTDDETTKVTASKTFVQTTVGVSIASAVGVSLLKAGGSAAATSVLKHVQVLLMFMLVDSNVDGDLSKIINDQDYALLNFNSVDLGEANGKRQLIDYLGDDQEDGNMQTIQFNSSSAFVNCLIILIIFAVLAALHFVLKLSPNPSPEGRGKGCLAWIWFREKALWFIKYVAYLRLMIIVQVAVLLASASEIMQYEGGSDGRVLSLVLALILFALAMSLPFVAFINYTVNMKDLDLKSEFFWSQFYAGTRPTKWAALYSTWSLTRSTLFVLTIIFLAPLGGAAVFSILLALQLIYLAGIIAVRPFKSVWLNALDITNESFIVTYIIIFLVMTNKEWGESVTDAMLGLIVTNIALIFILIIGNKHKRSVRLALYILFNLCLFVASTASLVST